MLNLCFPLCALRVHSAICLRVNIVRISPTGSFFLRLPKSSLRWSLDLAASFTPMYALFFFTLFPLFLFVLVLGFLFEFGYIPSNFSLENVLRRTQMKKMVVFGVSLALSQ